MERAGPGVSAPETSRGITPGPADLEDVHRARSGDARAFHRLYQRHVARVHGLARRMIGPEHADEVTQDVFVRAWEKLATFRGEAAFGTWLFRIGVNEVLNRRARLGIQRGRYGGGDEVLEAQSWSPAPAGLKLDLDRAVGQLPRGARDVFVLHDMEGYRHEEIAGMLGVTTGTTKAQLHRARMLLRETLAR